MLVFLCVLLFGNLGLGLTGVAVHHGYVGALEGWLVALPATLFRSAVLWRFREVAAESRSEWTKALLHALHGTLRSAVRALVVPVLGYGWAHAVHLLPAVLGTAVSLLALIALGWLLRHQGMAWRRLRREWRRVPRVLRRFQVGHVLWFAFTPLWALPNRTVTDVLGDPILNHVNFLPESFHWIDPPYRGVRTAFTRARGVVLGSRTDEPRDVFLVRVALSHEGQPVRVEAAYNLSATSAVDEADLTRWQKWVAWTIRYDAAVQSIELADLRGEARGQGEAWSATRRLQRALSNRQQTGLWRGVGRSRVEFTRAGGDIELALEDGRLNATFPDRKLQIELGRAPDPEMLGEGTTYHALGAPLPGALVPWAVDRVRAIPWVGSERMQWLKAWVFRAGEQLEALEQSVVGIDPDETITEQLGDILASMPLARAGDVPDWPPLPIEPLLNPSLTGEGVWVSLAEELIAAEQPGAPSPFVFAFIRTDRERPYIQTSISLWDPRRIRLHIVAGTEEPKSMTGELGSGLVPRDPKVLRRFVAAFNGAFQAVHGEFGMMERGRVQLPPKPYAATVATWPDGTAALGTWPPETAIPTELVSYRQNLTPLVLDGQVNPYRNTWWGGVPLGWEAEARTVRSGMCLTAEGFLAYFYSPGIDPEALGQAMLRTRCTYGVHLDMNAGHTGFEFYRVEPAGKLPDLGRALDLMWEAQGSVSGVPGFEFVSRLMVRKMPLMNFPRYVHSTSRDFFYLTRRALLPGAPLTPLLDGHEDDGQWHVAGVDGNLWPYAVALTGLHAADDRGRVHRFVVTRIDPKQLRRVDTPETATLGLAFPEASGQATLLWENRAFLLEEPDRGSTPATGGSDPTEATVAAACLDADGLLALVEPEGKSTGVGSAPLHAVLGRLDCVQRVFFHTPVRALVTQSQRQNALAAANVAWFTRDTLAGAGRLFPKTPVVPPSGWAILQKKPVPYSGRAADGASPQQRNPK
jgi:hypothetical protein